VAALAAGRGDRLRREKICLTQPNITPSGASYSVGRPAVKKI
jgi:hypothetical protein